MATLAPPAPVPATASAPTPATAAPRGRVRPALVRLHRACGLAIAGFLAFAGISGSLLVFQPEIDAWLNPGLFAASPAGAILSPQELANRVEAADGRVRARWIPWSPTPTHAADIWVDWKVDPATGSPFVADHNQMFVDPRGGAINGRRLYGVCCFERAHAMAFVHQLHSNLWLPGRAGAILLGAVSIIWTVTSLFGIYLSLPASGGLRGWRQAWRVKPGGGPARRNYDLHRAGGLWTWAAMLLIAISGVALTLEHEVFDPAVEAISPMTPLRYLQRTMAAADAPYPARLSFDDAVAVGTRAARVAGVGEELSGIYHAAEYGVYGVGFGDEADAGLGASWVYVDSRTGGIVDLVPATAGTAGDLFARMQLPLHSGRIGGVATRVLLLLLGLATAALSITGLLIWRRKRRARLWHEARRPTPRVARASITRPQ